MPAPGWYPDPTGRHHYRWWAGRWTWRVTDRARVGQDPLRPAGRMALGVALLLQLGFAPIVAFWFIGGDPDCSPPRPVALGAASAACHSYGEPSWAALGGILAVQIVAGLIGLILLQTPRYPPPSGADPSR